MPVRSRAGLVLALACALTVGGLGAVGVDGAAGVGEAHAQPESVHPGLQFGVKAQPEEPAPRKTTRWYGLLSIPLDVAVTIVAYSVDDRLFVGYVLAGPALHILHGHPARGVASFGLRLVVPIGPASFGGSFAEFICDVELDNCRNPKGKGTEIGRVLGMTIATILDIVLLGSDESPRRKKPRGVLEYRGVGITPAASPTAGGWSVGVLGRF